MSSIQRAFRQLSSAEAPTELAVPTYSEKLGMKQEGIEAHLNWIRPVNLVDLCAYSDGSSDGSSEGYGRSS